MVLYIISTLSRAVETLVGRNLGVEIFMITLFVQCEVGSDN